MKFYKRIIIAIVVAFLTVGSCSIIALAAESKPALITDMEFDVAKSLKEREEQVEKREAELRQKEETLAALEKEVDEKLARLVALQSQVKGELEELTGAQSTEFKNLVKVYSAMSSTKVAPILNEMDDVTISQILRAMKTDVVAKIIPKLDPAKAVSVSKELGMLDTITSQ